MASLSFTYSERPSPQFVAVALPSNTLLRKSHLMVAEAKGATYQFHLMDIDRAVSTISGCVAKTKVSGVAAAGDFSAPPPKPATISTVAKSTESEAPAAPENRLGSST
jgi:hypothetical protein